MNRLRDQLSAEASADRSDHRVRLHRVIPSRGVQEVRGAHPDRAAQGQGQPLLHLCQPRATAGTHRQSGRESLAAVMQPDGSGYFYFVSKTTARTCSPRPAPSTRSPWTSTSARRRPSSLRRPDAAEVAAQVARRRKTARCWVIRGMLRLMHGSSTGRLHSAHRGAAERTRYQELHWEGPSRTTCTSAKNPKVARTAFQRVYDMIFPTVKTSTSTTRRS